MSRRMTILLFAVVAAQVIGLVVFASVRQVALTQGREVTLQTVPVDPRSLLQGDYAILDYEIAELHEYLEGPPGGHHDICRSGGVRQTPGVRPAAFLLGNQNLPKSIFARQGESMSVAGSISASERFFRAGRNGPHRRTGAGRKGGGVLEFVGQRGHQRGPWSTAGRSTPRDR